jgi:hypothetical protein
MLYMHFEKAICITCATNRMYGNMLFNVKYIKYADFYTLMCMCVWHHMCGIHSSTSGSMCSAMLK